VIDDLHCHYAMHLLPDDRHPHRRTESWLERVRHDIEADLTGLAARLLNNRDWGSGWRVDLDGLRRGGAGVVCSVLYWPAAELDFDTGYGSDPEAGYFTALQHQLEAVEADLRRLDPDGERHVAVRRAADLDDDSRVRFVPCVEGGFHLGGEEDRIDENVRWLADRGVAYVTLAHLFFRGVAHNAPALPLLSDAEYDRWFRQRKDIGLTPLGRAAVRAMHRHKVMVDISHMRRDAVDETFELLAELDRDAGAAARDLPVIASHVGMRAAAPTEQAYNLTPEIVRRITERDGVIGLIFAQHQLGATRTEEESRAALNRHIEAIAQAADGHAHTAIGSDLDGFIKPTLSGVERAADLAKVEEWIRGDHPADADAILWGNARRVVRQALRAREAR
jgi:microsomal dipeptidase-like Zn-dependent dipeptidase